MSCPSLVVFGSQTTWPPPQYLSQLRAILLLEPSLHPFLTAIKDLDATWQSLIKFDPRLEAVPGNNALNSINHWLDHGEFPRTSESPPNVLSTPCTTILHIAHYMHYLNENKEISHSRLLEYVAKGGIQGFCTGLLTAFALACSNDEKDVSRLGGVALRLALAIGAYVDLEGAYANPPNETRCFAVRWRAEIGKDRILEILEEYPEVYVSVVADSNSLTITAPRSSSSSIYHALSSHGIIIKSITLEGRFHSSANRDAVERLSRFCDANAALQFPNADQLLAPVRSNSDSQVISNGPLHKLATDAIMTQICDWYLTLSAATSQLIQTSHPSILQVGMIDCIPTGIARDAGLHIIKAGLSKSSPATLSGSYLLSSPGTTDSIALAPDESRYPDHAIAVVGMACKFPGADSPSEFWDLLTTGTSMLAQLPSDRFPSTELRRSSDNKLKFWGNFISDAGAFDHAFFKKSSRESASMDPQQRLLLQVAYQAIESAGYFGDSANSKLLAEDIGCYLGVGGTDYSENVASHPPTAYSALGTLRAFLSGKISHFFGWTGPSITFDTACSSSAVAIHTACKAIETGECSQAVAGGVSLFTSPNMYQNLAAASFLSPTGATKPFDAKADGYCRGEGVGLVVLKRLSDAIAEGDNVLSVIAGSAVNQNHNSTSITVPHSESQVKLYTKANARAGVNAMDVSYVEAHGTGTPVGDPIEFESIRKVYGGASRSNSVHVSSVKGNIGHLEGASGVAALIKTTLMLENRKIPVQANFTRLNPKIAALQLDKMAIPMSKDIDWDTDFRVACINNYGASGNNAAMIVCQPPQQRNQMTERAKLSKLPIYISANSPASLAAYCMALHRYIDRLDRAETEKTLSSMAFNLASKQNRSFPHFLTGTVSSLSDLKDLLSTGASTSSLAYKTTRPSVMPVVLVFGGQINNYVGLEKNFYHSSVLFASKLDLCDSIIRARGLPSLYPQIFETKSVSDTVSLHCQLFSLQYSCAQSWIACGLKVDALIGHSFGQLTALCVSGSLSLEDGLKLVSGRASLMQKHWGPERGSMISIQASLDEILNIISSVEKAGSENSVEIACYNGPSSHVLVGSEASIEAVEATLAGRTIKSKKLNVTHGFHSKFSEPLLPALTKLAEELNFSDTVIPLETCSDHQSWTKPDPQLITEHTRTPVYFAKAINRLSHRLGPCTWLEAGSKSSTTSLIRKALDSPSTADVFQAVQLTSSSFAETTVNLWKAGYSVQFWPYHRDQSHEYTPMMLPPYQFEKHNHWLEWIDTVNEAAPTPIAVKAEAEPELLSFLGYSDRSQRQAEFAVDPRSETYKFYVEGHAVLSESLCPASLYFELVAEAAMTLANSSTPSSLIPRLENLDIRAPLGLNDRAISIFLRSREGSKDSWEFELSSKPRDNKTGDANGSQKHASGRVRLDQADMTTNDGFARYERLVGHNRYTELMADPKAEALQGALIYKVFGKVVSYKDYYRGVKSVCARDGEAAGAVTLPHGFNTSHSTLTLPVALDNFVQVAGLHVNCLNEVHDNEVYVCTKIDRTQLSSHFRGAEAIHDQALQTTSWVVYSNFHASSDKEVTNDIFVFDAASKSLVVMILGARFTKVLMTSLAKVLSRVNTAGSNKTSTALTMKASASLQDLSNSTLHMAQPIQSVIDDADEPVSSPDLDTNIRNLLHKVSDIPMESLGGDATFEDLGIDSLMVTEVLAELQKTFQVEVPLVDFQNLPGINSLVKYLRSRGCGASGSSTPDSSTESRVSTNTPASSLSAAPSLDIDISQLAKLVAENLDTTTKINLDTNLAEQGLDSLCCIELANDIKTAFGVDVDMTLLAAESTFGDLIDMVVPRKVGFSSAEAKAVAVPVPAIPAAPILTLPKFVSLSGAQRAFERVRYDYDIYAKQTSFLDFWKITYPDQARLVLAYVVEAFTALGCPIAALKPDERLPSLQYLPKHSKVMAQYHGILRSKSLIIPDGNGFVRSQEPVDTTPSSDLYDQILRNYPQHAYEHRLLHSTGSKLADCLTGAVDPIQIMFGSKTSRDLMTDVYTSAPMFDAITRLLGAFLGQAFATPPRGETYNILELGGGTGGTTAYIVDYLVSKGIPFTLTFTDISASLVATARKRFAGRDYMKFMTLDIEKPPPEQFTGYFHTVISSNCIHATKNLVVTTSNIRKMLRPDGFLSLVELTKNIPWFDLVFGLLEGWWLFDDGRQHALANEWLWDSDLRSAGFKHVSWSDGESEEARGLRVITAFPAEAESPELQPCKRVSRPSVETVLFKQVGETSLYADIYFPSETKPSKRPIALMIHGGGHIMLSRKDIRPKQTQLLLEHGYIPVSIDYRLCPEMNLLDGPMTDVCDALRWARDQLPTLELDCPGLQIDGSKVAAIGWSTGGHLAMTLGWTSRLQNVQPPEAILAFYCPTDYEDKFWQQPNTPEGSSSPTPQNYNLLEAVQDNTITAYNIPRSTRSLGGWMSLTDPRSLVALHMNWRGQTLPILLNGLPSLYKASSIPTDFYNLPQPALEKITAASPYAQIVRGAYRTPTFLLHGTADDLIPWQQSQRVYDALVGKGVPAGIVVPEGGVHLFDMYRDPDGKVWEAVRAGYDFIFAHV